MIADDSGTTDGSIVVVDATSTDGQSPLDAGTDGQRPRDAGFDARPSDAGFDARPSDAGFDARPSDGGSDGSVSPPACFDPGAATMLEGVAPTLGQNLCDATSVRGFYTACLGPGANGTVCDAFVASNPACARCLAGALPGEVAATTPVPALVPAGDGLVINVASCAALVIGRPDCAVSVVAHQVCTSSVCTTCNDDASDVACAAAADAAVCAPLVDAACTAALQSSTATWQSTCRAADAVGTFNKVAAALCGP